MGMIIINWRYGREKVLRDYLFCEIVVFYLFMLYFVILNFLYLIIMKFLIVGRWLIYCIF